jgi:hypothetical protein
MNKLKTFRRFAAFCGGIVGMTAVLSAGTITFNTPSGSLSGTESVDATATFVTSPGVLTVTLQSLTSNIQDASQLLSDLQFTLSSGGTATLASSSGHEVTVDKNGVPTASLLTVSTGWGFGTDSGGFILCDVCPGGATLTTSATLTPAHTIITTQSSYSANGSIEGNNAHNPFLDGTATFTIDDSAITTDTVVDSATFSFSTAAGVDVPGDPGSPVPEPNSLMLLGSGLFGFGLLSRKLRKQS